MAKKKATGAKRIGTKAGSDHKQAPGMRQKQTSSAKPSRPRSGSPRDQAAASANAAGTSEPAAAPQRDCRMHAPKSE